VYWSTARQQTSRPAVQTAGRLNGRSTGLLPCSRPVDLPSDARSTGLLPCSRPVDLPSDARSTGLLPCSRPVDLQFRRQVYWSTARQQTSRPAVQTPGLLVYCTAADQ
ncbi:hypothetical protein NHX12_002968, partial [Muraenolepis orangiensis]